MPPIQIVDYGAGNLASVLKAFAAVGADARIAATPNALDSAGAIVVPGVGHFGVTGTLSEAWRSSIRAAITARTPLLGICLGMQWLMSGSDEAPDTAGLGVFPGRCVRLGGAVKVPHVGWNTLETRGESCPLLDGIGAGAAAYFTHTYAVPVIDEAIATTTYGQTFAAVIAIDRILGVQFHPEKSGSAGLRLLANFARLARTTNSPC
ncbi:MAG TPA: imidazole glycerol phosphate synthase subunit HisH [Vicinamibacterales bacterium]|nr:imidazole glycerol phosphate synthase subunit HisH [Vicinamibacterales bacterium]